MEPDFARITVAMSNFGITELVAASSKTGSLSYGPEEQLMFL